eukprot:6190369-Pleurochrysis_carterae.AAC.10
MRAAGAWSSSAMRRTTRSPTARESRETSSCSASRSAPCLERITTTATARPRHVEHALSPCDTVASRASKTYQRQSWCLS